MSEELWFSDWMMAHAKHQCEFCGEFGEEWQFRKINVLPDADIWVCLDCYAAEHNGGYDGKHDE